MMTLERYEGKSKEVVLSTTNSATRCLFANQAFSEAVATNEIISFFRDLNEKIDLNSLPSNVFVQKRGESNELTAFLYIDFFSNRLVTFFQGKERSIKLSSALGIIRDLSEIFAKIQSSTTNSETQKLLSVEDEFSNALDTTKSSTSDKLSIDGEDVIAFYPLSGRVVLSTSRGQSSIPIEMIQNCAHLFNREFAQSICPLLGLDSNLNGLLSGINKLYLGRCILGLGKSMAIQSPTHIGNERELSRIVSLIKIPGSEFYTEPLM